MNCQSFKNQIDESAFTAELNRHLEACGDCKTFREERLCLERLLTKLEQVNAPTNFEFGVRAKLNSLPADNNRIWLRRFAFASPALAAVAVTAFVFTGYNDISPNNSQPLVVQSNNPEPILNSSPAISTTQQTAAASNTNFSIETPVVAKQNTSALNQTKQVAFSNVSAKQPNPAPRKKDDDRIQSKDSVDAPMNSRQMALEPAPTPLIPDEFKKSVAGKVSAREVLSFFEIKVAIDGTIESVGSKSAAAENGIRVGDRIETINGQKFAGTDLDSSLRQVTIGVFRNGTKRIVTLETSSPK